MSGYDGLLLDHDGVIVSLTERSTLRRAVRGAFGDAGVSDPSREDVAALTIRVSEQELQAVADRHGVAPETLWRHREDRIETLLCEETATGEKRPYDDTAALEGVSVPTGVVSNNQTRIVEYVLDCHGLGDWFETVRAREPTVESLRVKKPEPTFLERAAADLGCSAPLYVGDSESDVVAATRAGVDVVFLRRRHNADRDLDATPTHEAESLDAVVELLRGRQGV